VASTSFKLRVEGADEVIRALDKVPADAREAMRQQAKDIATSLADFIKIDGRKHSRQASRVADTVREGNRGVWPVVTASNTGKARRRGGGLLFGSIFGMKRHTGWYNHRRYNRPGAGHQFGPYIGYPGYWFFKTAEDRQSWIESEWQKAADEVVRRWSA
jgi:hypothetical protein